MNDPVGMEAFVSALQSGISSNTIWAEITTAAPFVIMIFIIAVGYMILRRVIRKGSRLKAGI